MMAFLNPDLIKRPCDCEGYKRRKAKERSLLEYSKA